MFTFGRNVGAAGAAAPQITTAKLLKTGQTTSYRTGDDGDIEAGRDVSFTVLAENNPFGNTNRFTDELGGQTYTNNIVIDWSTYNGSNVLGFRRTNNGADATWAQAIDGALAVSIGSFTTGWRLPNIMEVKSLVNYGVTSYGLNYVPFSTTLPSNFWWTATTDPNTTANAYRHFSYLEASAAKTSSSGYRYFPCRTFTVTGTTLS